MSGNNFLNSSNLKSFKINDLFGKKDVIITFEQNPLIIIGENGTGKTTILSALYNTLSGKFNKLRNTNFSSIELKLKSGEEITIKKDEVNYIPEVRSRAAREMKSRLTDEEIIRLINLDRDGLLEKSNFYRYIRRKLEMPYTVLKRTLNNLDESDYNLFEKQLKKINNGIKNEILYFPTYRRIEEDLNNLGYNNTYDIKKHENTLIQFGMEDVSTRFKELTSDIKNLAIQGFSKVTGEMLKQLVNGIKVTQEMRDNIKHPEALEIVLDRSGDNISDSEKDNIISLIKTGNIFESPEKYGPLIYFLSNLIKIYKQQREKDNLIKRFAEVCNKYLVKKKVIYDESAVEIGIFETKTNKPIKLSQLSSGEKQIVSIFAKIYLSEEDNFIILFDEPELSLSLEWQQQLLPDILDSNRCSFLLAVTHSPFIFDNKLDTYAKDLNLYTRGFNDEC